MEADPKENKIRIYDLGGSTSTTGMDEAISKKFVNELNNEAY